MGGRKLERLLVLRIVWAILMGFTPICFTPGLKEVQADSRLLGSRKVRLPYFFWKVDGGHEVVEKYEAVFRGLPWWSLCDTAFSNSLWREFSKWYYFKLAGFDNHLSIPYNSTSRHEFKIDCSPNGKRLVWLRLHSIDLVIQNFIKGK